MRPIVSMPGLDCELSASTARVAHFLKGGIPAMKTRARPASTTTLHATALQAAESMQMMSVATKMNGNSSSVK